MSNGECTFLGIDPDTLFEQIRSAYKPKEVKQHSDQDEVGSWDDHWYMDIFRGRFSTDSHMFTSSIESLHSGPSFKGIEENTAPKPKRSLPRRNRRRPSKASSVGSTPGTSAVSLPASGDSYNFASRTNDLDAFNDYQQDHEKARSTRQRRVLKSIFKTQRSEQSRNSASQDLADTTYNYHDDHSPMTNNTVSLKEKTKDRNKPFIKLGRKWKSFKQRFRP
ncbi:hypothetical protein AMATHDRAFT_64718 [Amanita thiersii Skay4041]|uniref:Uncharacterized protein n=1 Tax=Amanita thiersii Skay4041 TaxID=703135 RepID=A0A2A9NKD7_9AGAR|nr:hypothetical protein AMATHDRAFT_64718 [Amanita thiersii Skay4041]